jgi:hypothetical protein
LADFSRRLHLRHTGTDERRLAMSRMKFSFLMFLNTLVTLLTTVTVLAETATMSPAIAALISRFVP